MRALNHGKSTDRISKKPSNLIVVSRSVERYATLSVLETEITDVQWEFHSEKVCDRSETKIEFAKKHGSLGCNENGLGGNAGGLTILSAQTLQVSSTWIKEVFRHRRSRERLRDIPESIAQEAA